MSGGHHHYFYILDLQPRVLVEEAQYGLTLCPQTVDKGAKQFRRINGNRSFCIYVLLFLKTTPASSSPKVCYELMESAAIFPESEIIYIEHNAELIAMSSPCLIRRGLLNKVKEYFNGTLAMDKEQLLGLLDQCTMFEIQEEATKNRLVFDEF